MPANIEPVAFEVKDIDLSYHRASTSRQVQADPTARLLGCNSKSLARRGCMRYVDGIVIGGLFDVVGNPVISVYLNHTEVNFYISGLITGDGGKCAALAMIVEHSAVIDGGEQIAVHHQKGIVQKMSDEGNRSCRAEGLLLARIIDTSVELTPSPQYAMSNSAR